MKISIGSDHAGFEYKERFRAFLTSQGHEVVDFGTDSPESTDYPLYIIPAAEAVANGQVERGIVLGGSGNGEAIAANKVRGVRCALCWNTQTAEFSRKHNDANVLSIGQRMISYEIAEDILKIWLATAFEGGRHARRLTELANYESGRGLSREEE